MQNWGGTHCRHRKPGDVSLQREASVCVNTLWRVVASQGACLLLWGTQSPWKVKDMQGFNPQPLQVPCRYNLHDHWQSSLAFYLFQPTALCSWVHTTLISLSKLYLVWPKYPDSCVFCISWNTLLLPHSWVILDCPSKFSFRCYSSGKRFLIPQSEKNPDLLDSQAMMHNQS